MIYRAHVRETTGEIQTIKEHAEGTAELAAEFSIPELADVMKMMGLLHDTGKFLADFQRRIGGENIRVEHSICGAKEVKKLYNSNLLGMLMAYCIAGHHGGLPDGGYKGENTDGPSLHARLNRECGDYSAYREEICLPMLDDRAIILFLVKNCNNQIEKLVDQFAFWTRYAYSCLVDADWIDTETFCVGERPRGMRADFRSALALTEKKLDEFVCKTKLQKSRAGLQKQVFDGVERDAEIYLVNMPTGSGKTLCSVKAALKRALKKGKKRIIYICPFNAIIDQTARDLSDLFGDTVEILRHQSTFSYEEQEDLDEDYRTLAARATENWDARFIITTAVQFFETVNSNRRGKLRKMHNLADSVLVFDEAHLMPQKYLQPCLQAVAYITRYLNSEAFFLTATMPDFERLIRRYAMEDSEICNLVQDRSLFSAFRKCKYRDRGMLTAEQLLMSVNAHTSALVIVNRKATARELYRQATGKKYHLSTYLTARDRERMIAEIKKELANPETYTMEGQIPPDSRIQVFSTSLVEAGVDLDFCAVYRELSGLDSILQAGGRCNREGKRDGAEVHIFRYDGQDGKRSPDPDERAELTKGLLEEYEDISCPESIAAYYDRLFFVNEQEIEHYAMHQFCRDYNSVPFRKYAEHFHIVESENTVSVVVPQDEKCRKMIDEIKRGEICNARAVQSYTCTVSRKEFDDLYGQHVIEDYGTGIWCLTNLDYYDKELGITFEARDYVI